MGKIVWLASYPKSGNTWLRAFLHNYIAQPTAPQSINALIDFSAVECAAAFFDSPGDKLTPEATQRLRPSVHESLTRLHDDLVFVKTHNANLALHGVPLCTPAHTAGSVYIVRDPRDIALSYAAFAGKSVEDIITFMASPQATNRATAQQVFEFMSSWSGHVRSWLSAKNRLVLRYEDLLADPEKHFGRVIYFLGGDSEPARLRRAVEFSSFATLAAQEQTHGYVAASAVATAPFFRAGRSGEFRTGLTLAQRLRIETDHATVLRQFHYLPPA